MFPLYSRIWRISGRRQIFLIILSLAISGLAALPLKFQQQIVNLLNEETFQASHLLGLGSGMIGAILLSLLLKWLMGYRSQLLGEDMIRLIRTRLIKSAAKEEQTHGDILTGTLSTAISAEAEELGKFAGIAFSEPVMQIGTLISVVVFVASTQPTLGIVAFAIVLPQIAIVLFSQRKVNALLEDRVRILRETTDEISSPQLQSSLNEILHSFDEIFETRRLMFQWKLSAKFILRAITGLGTVSIFMLGGLYVLQGKTDVGTVVAATTGLSRLQGPNTFLISFYRQVSANRVKFVLLTQLSLHKDDVT